MRIHAKGIQGKLWDLETGDEIMRPIWFDEADGYCECYQTNAFGRIMRDRRGDKLTWLLQGKFKWVPEDIEISNRSVGHKCKECSEDAEWSVGDETPVESEITDGVLYARGKLTKIRHYCSRHYKAPRIVDDKGEIMTVWDDAGGVRPQW